MECEYCHSGLPHLHLSGCPECPDPPVVYICDNCGESICDGDTFCRIGEDKYCEHCIDDSKETAEIEIEGYQD